MGENPQGLSMLRKRIMKNPDPLEKDIERKVCDYAKSLKMLVYKFTSPSRRSVPDRMFITSSGVVFFIEFKRRGQKPTAAQDVEIAKIKAQGVVVGVVDNVDVGKHLVKEMASDRAHLYQFSALGEAASKDLDSY